MIKLNYFVHSVTFWIGSGRGQAAGAAFPRVFLLAPHPPRAAVQRIARSLPFVCSPRAGPRREREEGRLGDAFIKHAGRLAEPCCCPLSSSMAPKENEGLGAMGSAAATLGTARALRQGKLG